MLIDNNELIDKLKAVYRDSAINGIGLEPVIALYDVIKLVNTMPEAVVRCKECIHSVESKLKTDDTTKWLWCTKNRIFFVVREDNFCMYGEKAKNDDVLPDLQKESAGILQEDEKES
jgi:hypothetical protein